MGKMNNEMIFLSGLFLTLLLSYRTEIEKNGRALFAQLL